MSAIMSCTGKLNELINQSISRANFNDCIELYRFILHNTLFYKHLHKKHHELKATIAISTLYCHPIENAVNLGTVAIVSWLKIKQDFVRRNLNYVFFFKLGSIGMSNAFCHTFVLGLVLFDIANSQSFGLRSALLVLPLSTCIETRFPSRTSSQWNVRQKYNFRLRVGNWQTLAGEYGQETSSRRRS